MIRSKKCVFYPFGCVCKILGFCRHKWSDFGMAKRTDKSCFLQLTYVIILMAILASVSTGTEKFRLCCWIVLEEKTLNNVGKRLQTCFIFVKLKLLCIEFFFFQPITPCAKLCQKANELHVFARIMEAFRKEYRSNFFHVLRWKKKCKERSSTGFVELIWSLEALPDTF